MRVPTHVPMARRPVVVTTKMANGVGDACDNCPADPNADQHDRGELEVGAVPDGVGDVCDPRPSVTGDRIALFVPFVESPFAQFETSSNVTWDDTDVLHLGDGTEAGQASFAAVPQFTRAAWRMRVRAVSPGDTNYTGLWTRISNRSLTDAVFSHVQMRSVTDSRGSSSSRRPMAPAISSDTRR